MGMDLTGITIKPNGKYLARVRTKQGRLGKTFEDVDAAKKWIAEMKAKDESGSISPLMTLNSWFIFLTANLLTDIRTNTLLSYKSKYSTWIGPSIGQLRMCDIKPYHCIAVLNKMKDAGRKPSSIDQVKIVMHIIFEYALENELISLNPVTKSVKVSTKITPFKDSKFLTRSEQIIFLNEAKHHKHYEVFRFILETGLRYGELTGLKWDDIYGRVMSIKRQAYFLEDYGEFMIGPPKSEKGYRDIYLTNAAMDILASIPKTSEYVFPIEKRSTYNIQLKRICKKCGISQLSIHKLRHTFATRCIESGMKPKTLQRILGHSDVTITLNYYVHVGDDEMAREMEVFSGYQVGTTSCEFKGLCV